MKMSSTFNYGITATGLGQSTIIPSSIWRQLAASKEFREEFNALQLKRGVSFQIRALLNKRGWTQARLAEESKLTQGVVSRAQDANYGNLTINTINRLANGFDVAFIGEFVPFSELIEWFENLSEQIGEIEPFDKEYRELLKGRTVTARRHALKKKSKRNLTMKKRQPVFRELQSGQMKLDFEAVQAANEIRFPSKAGEASSIPNSPTLKAAAMGAGAGAYYGNR
jgi:transcriptional regulator with XRE-family HTH domain